jgi:hypothetical protein
MTQLTPSQLTHIAAKTNQRGAAFEHPYTFITANAGGGDTLIQITVHVIAHDFNEMGQDRMVKGFWASYPEGNPVDIPAVNQTISGVLDNVEKRIVQDVRRPT